MWPRLPYNTAAGSRGEERERQRDPRGSDIVFYNLAKSPSITPLRSVAGGCYKVHSGSGRGTLSLSGGLSASHCKKSLWDRSAGVVTWGKHLQSPIAPPKLFHFP